MWDIFSKQLLSQMSTVQTRTRHTSQSFDSRDRDYTRYHTYHSATYDAGDRYVQAVQFKFRYLKILKVQMKSCSSAPISCQHSSPGTPPLLTCRCDTYIISAALCSLRCALFLRDCTHTCTLHHTMHFVVQINDFHYMVQ